MPEQQVVINSSSPLLYEKTYDPPMPNNQTEIAIVMGSLLSGIQRELEHSNLPPHSTLIKKITNHAFRFEQILHSLNGSTNEKISPQLPKPMDDYEFIDQLKMIDSCTNRGLPNSLEMLILSYSTELLYAQAIQSGEHPIKTAAQLLADYKLIATKIFGEPNGNQGYTDDSIKDRYRLALEFVTTRFPEFTTTLAPTSLATSAGDGLEVGVLNELGVSTIACDILPLELLGPATGEHSTIQNLAHDPRAKLELYTETDACDLLADRIMRRAPKLIEINNLGSGLVNTPDLSVLFKFFYLACQNLVDGGILNLETHFIDGNHFMRQDNPISQAISEYQNINPSALPYTKSKNQTYRSIEDDDQTFGAQLHSYTLIRSIAHLCGFRFVSKTLEDINLASQHFRDLSLQSLKDNVDRNPLTSPVWITKNGTQRIFYVLEKVTEPNNLARVLLKHVYSLYNQRFPDYATNPSPDEELRVM